MQSMTIGMNSTRWPSASMIGCARRRRICDTRSLGVKFNAIVTFPILATAWRPTLRAAHPTKSRGRGILGLRSGAVPLRTGRGDRSDGRPRRARSPEAGTHPPVTPGSGDRGRGRRPVFMSYCVTSNSIGPSVRSGQGHEGQRGREASSGPARRQGRRHHRRRFGDGEGVHEGVRARGCPCAGGRHQWRREGHGGRSRRRRRPVPRRRHPGGRCRGHDAAGTARVRA